ncbi:aromatic ring-opening dioxygenase LigA [Actinoplanes sp. NBC_00393]|uniref:aromatic ring-opening dioxygenase LigA n=1 Tax=Actinoplanes sp. NBC_00393 TaxID=2975953 RepID=UPI002E1B8A27
MSTAAAKVNRIGPAKPVRVIAILLMLAGLVMVVAGATTWFTVQSQLADERITVSEDADWFAGEKIDGPLTAYAEAQIIEKHALESSGGKTYAELDREDPARQTVMNGSFLRASLFTSVVSFGIAAMAMGLGVVIALIGYAQFLLARSLAAALEAAA